MTGTTNRAAPSCNPYPCPQEGNVKTLDTRIAALTATVTKFVNDAAIRAVESANRFERMEALLADFKEAADTAHADRKQLLKQNLELAEKVGHIEYAMADIKEKALTYASDEAIRNLASEVLDTQDSAAKTFDSIMADIKENRLELHARIDRVKENIEPRTAIAKTNDGIMAELKAIREERVKQAEFNGYVKYAIMLITAAVTGIIVQVIRTL